jgi:hypothetical protein
MKVVEVVGMPAAVKRAKRKRKTNYTQAEWRRIFGEASKWCAKNKAPGEKQYECVRKYLLGQV